MLIGCGRAARRAQQGGTGCRYYPTRGRRWVTLRYPHRCLLGSELLYADAALQTQICKLGSA
jgi:hypothetical protein